MLIEQQLRIILENVVATLCDDGELPPEAKDANFQIEQSKSAEHGDFASNIAMVLTKTAQKPPRLIAQTIINKLGQNPHIHKIDIAGPGFLNMWIADELLWSVVQQIFSQGIAYGTHQQANPKKILLEYVSANPTGPLHLAHARGAFVGDVVARLLKAAGHDVTREFYVNDYGNQIKILGQSVYTRYRQLFGEEVQLAAGEYPGEYVIKIAEKLKAADGNKWLNKSKDEWLERCTQIAIAHNMEDIRKTLELVDVKFDNWYVESSLHKTGKVEQIIEDYRARDMLYDAERSEGVEEKIRREESKAAKYADKQLGGTFLRTSQFGDEEDRILLKSDGTPVYLVADLAYHQDKYKRGFTHLIDVFGADHAGHIPRIKAGMQALGYDETTIDCIVVQIMRLFKDGQEVKFSKRSGNIYLLSDLIHEVGVDAARFIFLMRAPASQFDFNLNLVLESNSDNPVFYTQYGHARMATLLKRAQEQGQAFVGSSNITENHMMRLQLPEEKTMIKKMSLYPHIVLSAAENYEPHRLVYYCHDLIGEFHGYFTKYRHQEKIISEDKELTQGRLALVAALKQTLYNALTLLGVSAPESMGMSKEE